MAFAGFLTATGAMALLITAYLTEALHDLGWRGGEYANLFLVVTFASILGGAVLRARPRSRAFGTGLIIGGSAGIVIILGVLALVGYLFSRWNPGG